MKNATAAAIFLAITDFVTLLYEGTFVVQETGFSALAFRLTTRLISPRKTIIWSKKFLKVTNIS